ncbi:MAG: protoporphyrinogen/coproporphyrinogen oxidase [Myxococcota bacterium]
MERTRYLIIGAGVTGLAFADRIAGDDYLIIEREDEPGGYCRTVVQDGFVWDYSGHFFHFRHPEIERDLVGRMGDQRVLTVEKDSRILYGDRLIDFPFQKNIHQLPHEEFLDCLVDLYFREDREPKSFREMLYAKFGRSIAEKFLIPYNEKLYATDLASLDVDAMGRFFPYADVADVIRNFRRADNRSYNATFTYPEGGAVQYIQALLTGVRRERLRLGTAVEAVDLERRVARTTAGEVAFEHVVSSAPLPQLLEMCDVPFDRSVYTSNKVQVFNLGFDRKGHEGIHWIYVPQREVCFYRVGFYDNIFGTDRMSLYVEIGRPGDHVVDPASVEDTRERVLHDLRACGIVDGHRLVSWHHVVLDPAYVHITRASLQDVAQKKRMLETCGVHSLGRYGSWTYCSIEDNIVEARGLADLFNSLPRARRRPE